MSVKIQQLVDAVKHLADLHAKPLLALKAYDSILCDSVDPKYFYDYILHCNAFALGELSRKPLDANLARDYFRLALEQFAARGVQWREDEVENFLEVDQCAPGQGHEAGPSEGLGQFVESDVEDDLETCPCPLSIPDGMDDASLALLSLTLSNWACLEFCARNAKKAYALFELSSVAAAATLEPASPFGYRMEVAKVINRGVCQIMYCNFPEAEEILDATIPPLLEQRAALKAAVTIAENATASGSGEADRDESAIQDVIDPVPEGQEDKLLLDVSCLCGLSYYALGVAQEYGACEGAIGTYETALEYLTSVLAPREGTPATEGEESPGNGVKVATPVIDSTEECAASPSSPGEEVVPVAAEAASQEEPSKELVCADKQATPVSEDPRIEQAAGAPEGAEHSSGAPDCQVDAVVAEIGDHNSSGTPEIQQDIPDTIEDGQNDILQIISTTRDILLSYVSAAKEKAAAAWAEEAAKRDAMRKFRRRASTKKGSKKRQSILPESMGIDVPAIKAPLRTYIRREGLTTISAPVLSLEHALHYLHPVNEALAEEGIVEKPFVSPFAGTRAESGSCCVAAVLLCTQTPLQLAVEVRQAEKHPLPPNSVWGPRRVIPTYLMPEKDFLEKELIAAGNAEKKPPPVLKSLMPRPMPQSSVSAAQKGVNTAMKLLSQRLQVLLKAEKQYEDRWTASERIFSALTSYYVPQEMMKLKETLLEKKRIKNFRENRSARILVRFFRRVLEEKPREFGFLCKDQRRALQEGNAATTLQKYARRWLAIQHRHRLECKRRETIQKICVVQSLFRRQVAQAYCEKLRREKQQAEEEKERMLAQHYAATQIQKVYRGHRTRLLLWYYSGDTRKAMLHHLHDSRHYYASQIQKRVRGMLCRRRYGRAVYFKRCYGRNVYRAQLLECSSITIQRFYRGYRARRRYRSVILNRMKQIEENIEAQLKLEEDARAELEARVEFQAAARIQSTMRIKDATRHAEELRAARESAISSRKGEVYAPFNFDDCIF